MPVPLKAKSAFPYAGRSLRAGQDFSAVSESDARILIAIGRAARRQEYSTRVMVADVRQDLERMDVEQLRALAARMNVRVHWKAGADKLRSAIRSARG